MPATDHSSTVKFLNAMLLLVGVVTIGAGLYFAATDRLLLTGAVCFAGLIPAGALTYAVSRLEERPSGTRLVERQRRIGISGFALGTVALIFGGVLFFAMPGPLGAFLLWTGPGLAIGGLVVIGLTRTKARGQRLGA